MKVETGDKTFRKKLKLLFASYACFPKLQHLRVDQIQTGDYVVERLGDGLWGHLCIGCSMSEPGPLFARNGISNNIRFR